MDRSVGACGASFLPSWPSFQRLSSSFRTDSFVLPICDPLTGTIDGETRLRRKRSKGQSQKLVGSRLASGTCYAIVLRTQDKFCKIGAALEIVERPSQCGHCFISRVFSGRLHEDFFGRAFEVFEEGRTQPSFHFPLRPAIPITSVFGSSPNESGGVAWKGSCREDDFESDQRRLLDFSKSAFDTSSI